MNYATRSIRASGSSGDAWNQSALPREQETLCEVGDEPFFGNQSVPELAGHHLAPDHRTPRCSKALEGTLVCAPECLQPCHSVLAIDENLNLDLKVWKSASIHGDDLSEAAVTQWQVLVCDVSDVVRREELADRIQLSVGDERRVRGFNLRCKCSVDMMAC